MCNLNRRAATVNATTRIRRQGGAAIVTIPSALMKEMGVEVGAELSLSVADGELVARAVREGQKRYSLRELLEGSEHMAELNAGTRWAREGEPVGREIG